MRLLLCFVFVSGMMAGGCADVEAREPGSVASLSVSLENNQATDCEPTSYVRIISEEDTVCGGYLFYNLWFSNDLTCDNRFRGCYTTWLGELCVDGTTQEDVLQQLDEFIAALEASHPRECSPIAPSTPILLP